MIQQCPHYETCPTRLAEPSKRKHILRLAFCERAWLACPWKPKEAK